MLELIDGLSQEQQQVLTLKFVFNFSNGEAATILDKTEGAVKSLQHRALVSLQKQLAGTGGGMALQVGIVGLPGSGKTTLFTALTRAAGGGFGKENVGMASIADDRLGRLAELVGARKITPATIRVVDVPGTGPALLGGLRQVDAILAVTDGFSDGPIPPATWRRSSRAAGRRPRPRRAEAGAGREAGEVRDAALRKEVDVLQELLAHLDAGNTLRDFPGELPPELEPLTTKPLLAVENGPGGIDLKLEAELAELPDEEAAAYRGGLRAGRDGSTPPRRARPDHVLHRGREGDARLVAAPGPVGARSGRDDPLRHRARIHPRGDDHEQDLLDAGSHAEAAKRGTQRLEGKTYVVQDGDVLNIRFNI